MARIFGYPGVSQSIVIGDAALAVFQAHRQTGFREEAGGLLFATIKSTGLHIVEATPPHPKDSRARLSFRLDLEIVQSTINERFQHNLHYVGEWHTHPEHIPTASKRDLTTMASAFSKSRLGISSLTMIIVGKKINGNGLWVSLHNQKGYLRLCETE